MEPQSLRILIIGSIAQKECSPKSQIEKLEKFLNNLVKKNGNFDHIFCVGSVLGAEAKAMNDFKPYIKGQKEFSESCKVKFIDSSPMIGPFMHSKPEGHEIFKNFSFLGRSGIFEDKNGFRLAYLSGKDNDLYENRTMILDGNKELNDVKYTSNHFTSEDITKILEDYKKIVEKSGKPGVDLFLCNQWPINILKYTSDEFPDLYFNFSTKIAQVVNKISPRYVITSSCGKDLFYQRNVFMNNEGFATRFVSLSSLPNPDSKTAFKDKYLHALSIKPLVHSTLEELTEAEFGGATDQSKLAPGLRNPFLPPKGGDSDDYLIQEKLQLGVKLMEERKLTKDDDHEDSDESVQEIRNEIFVANLPRKCDYNDLKDFCARYGEIREIDMKYDNRTGKFRGFAIIKYNEDSCAEAAVEDSNRYRIQGRRISISYNKKRQAKKSTKTGDETCWFCFNNKDIERHLICNVGKELYVALPKGPVVDHHFLIIPKNHIQGALALPESARNELEKTKKMLTDFITEHDENDYFIFERNLPLKFENAMHMNLQVISLPPGAYDLDDRIQDMLRASMLEFEVLSGPVEEAFREETEAGEIEKYYLYFEYPGLRTAKGRGKVRLLVKVPKESNTNHLMQLGRVMVCELLEAREKANWKACELSNEEEISIVKKVTPMLEKYK